MGNTDVSNRRQHITSVCRTYKRRYLFISDM